MKKIAIILALLAVSVTLSFGQTASDSISMKKVLGGYQFYQGEQRLSVNQLVKTMKSNNQAYQLIKSAQSANDLAAIVGGMGGFMVGWPIGQALAGGDADWTMAGIGAGLFAVSIPISLSFNKKAKRAVEMYNGSLHRITFRDKDEFKLSLADNGIGLKLNF